MKYAMFYKMIPGGHVSIENKLLFTKCLKSVHSFKYQKYSIKFALEHFKDT